MKEVKILIVEDDEFRRDLFIDEISKHDYNVDLTFYMAVTAKQALDRIDKERYDWFLLDHDLGHETEDGRMVAKKIVELYSKTTASGPPVNIIIHSWNINMAKEMHNILDDAHCNITRAPFGPLVIDCIIEELKLLEPV